MLKTILTTVLALGLVSSVARAAPAPEGGATAKVVFQMTAGEIGKFDHRLVGAIERMAAWYEEQGRALKVAVVIHGDAYRLFVKDLASTPLEMDAEVAKTAAARAKTIARLHDELGVVFEVCGFGMKKHALTPDMLMPNIDVAPNAAIALVEWQNRGYAYLAVH